MDKNGKPAKKKAQVKHSEPLANEAGRSTKNTAAAKAIPADSGKKMGKGSAKGR